MDIRGVIYRILPRGAAHSLLPATHGRTQHCTPHHTQTRQRIVPCHQRMDVHGAAHHITHKRCSAQPLACDTSMYMAPYAMSTPNLAAHSVLPTAPGRARCRTPHQRQTRQRIASCRRHGRTLLHRPQTGPHIAVCCPHMDIHDAARRIEPKRGGI
jgi:hypothetical protein